jgi:aldose 1-epimerase
VAGTPYDFREPRQIGLLHLDYAFTDLERDDRGRAAVSLTSAGRTTSLWVDESHPYIEVFTADPLPGPARRGSLGVEPMTCPPNGLQTGEDVIRIEPGATVSTSWGVVPG